MSCAKPPSHEVRADAGFSLIELLVGMAILAGIALLVLPETRRVASSRALDAAAADLAALARMARAAAIRTGSERSLTIDLDARRYWVDGITGPKGLPSRLNISLTLPSHLPISEPPQHIRFLPGGSSSGAQIVLRDGGRSSTVVIDWFTGGSRVVP